MFKKIIIFSLLFYFLILFQMSFFVHFFEFIPNLILIAIILINFVEDPNDNSGIFIAVLAGFFLDIFSATYFGLYILLSLFISLFIKFIFKKYFQPVLRLKI